MNRAFLSFLLFFSIQFLLCQDKWIRIPQESEAIPSSDLFSESYYKMPSNILSSYNLFDKTINNEIILPNEKGEEEVFELIPVPLFSKSYVFIT